MKLLFDQNLSYKLCDAIADYFPGSSQVGRMRLGAAKDIEIWEAAKANGFTVVSQDADFAELALFRGSPLKVIWLRCGNQPTALTAALLRRRADEILAFGADSVSACLEIY